MPIVLAAMTNKPEVVSAIANAGGSTIRVTTTEAETIAALDGADAVILSDNAYSAPLATALKDCSTLRWLQIVTAGYDNATRLGVPAHAAVTSVGEVFSPSVAVHAVALMLALQRGVHRMMQAQANRTWERSLSNALVMPEDKTLLILGYGSIGRAVAKLVAPFGMKVIGLNRGGTSHALAAEVHKIDALHRLLPKADALLIAAPLRPETLGIVGARELAMMKPSAFLINVSRGKLVDTVALEAALREGRIAGAALDVTDPEPLPPDHTLWTAPGLIVSPHLAGAAGDYGARRQIACVAENIRRYLAGEPLQNVVRP